MTTMIPVGDNRRTRWHEAKLTSEQRVMVRDLVLRGWPYREIAEMYGVHPTTVLAIRDGTGSYGREA